VIQYAFALSKRLDSVGSPLGSENNEPSVRAADNV
jgi:hypothetical protein